MSKPFSTLKNKMSLTAQKAGEEKTSQLFKDASLNEKQAENDSSGWLSTYGIITAQRLLERYNIRLPHEDLLYALKTPHTFYHHLMKAPLRNVFNGIILQQTRDYQLYAQKLFVDYLLSGENGKNETAPGGTTREDLEIKRTELVEMNERFHQLELEHEKLIAHSQATLMAEALHWQKILLEIAQNIKQKLSGFISIDATLPVHQALTALLVRHDVRESISLNDDSWLRVEALLATPLTSELRQLFVNEINKLANFSGEANEELANYIQQIASMSVNMRQFRTDFYQFILHVNELIQLLPEYRLDIPQREENRAALQFDPTLGED